MRPRALDADAMDLYAVRSPKRRPGKASRAREQTASAAEWLAPSELRPWAGNPRRNDGEPVAAVARSIERFGFAAPIVARAETREIIAGHTRWKAAIKLGLERVPVRLLDVSEADAHALALADNRLGELSAWDDDMLRSALAAIEADDRELAGFARGLVAEEDPQAEREQDASSESEPESRPGEVYRLGPHVLVCGDSTDDDVAQAALDGAEPMLQIADPPFDDEYARWRVLPSAKVLGVWYRSKSALRWVAALPDEWGVHSLVFTGGARGQINLTLPCCQHEQVMVARRKWWHRKEDAIDRQVVRASGAERTADDRHVSHQTVGGGGAGVGAKWEKPQLQMALLMAYVPAGSVVWDPCAGSGASLIAAAEHGRIWRGCEMDPARVDAIRTRWARYEAAHG